MAEATFSFDHAVILVDDLPAATRDYISLGFTVIQGGEHRGGLTHNALVVFADGSYIELIAFKDQSALSVPKIPNPKTPKQSEERSPFERRLLLRQASGEGLVDFALLPSAIGDAIGGAARRGLSIHGPIPGGRLRPDGQQVSWQVGITDALDLPFLCADVTPRYLRVPGGVAQKHPNGVTGVVGITVAVADLDVSVRRYSALLGASPQRGSVSPLPGARSVDFSVGSVAITLTTPAETASSLSDHLAKRGQGPYALRLSTGNKANAGVLDLTRTHSARIELVL